jgi:hypothetical protein
MDVMTSLTAGAQANTSESTESVGRKAAGERLKIRIPQGGADHIASEIQNTGAAPDGTLDDDTPGDGSSFDGRAALRLDRLDFLDVSIEIGSIPK